MKKKSLPHKRKMQSTTEQEMIEKIKNGKAGFFGSKESANKWKDEKQSKYVSENTFSTEDAEIEDGYESGESVNVFEDGSRELLERLLTIHQFSELHSVIREYLTTEDISDEMLQKLEIFVVETVVEKIGIDTLEKINENALPYTDASHFTKKMRAGVPYLLQSLVEINDQEIQPRKTFENNRPIQFDIGDDQLVLLTEILYTTTTDSLLETKLQCLVGVWLILSAYDGMCMLSPYKHVDHKYSTIEYTTKMLNFLYE